MQETKDNWPTRFNPEQLKDIIDENEKLRGIIIVGTHGSSSGVTTLSHILKDKIEKGIIVLDSLTENTTSKEKRAMKNFLNESLSDFKIQENFEQPKSKYHK